MSYFSLFPEYSRRWLLRADTAGGILVGLIWFVIAMLINISGETALRVGLGILALVVVESGYGVFREERTMRAEREQKTVVKASLTSQAVDHPPIPGKFSLQIGVKWEVWTDQNLSTDQLGLNLIYTYSKRWWQFWKRSRIPVVGIPPKGASSTHYRRLIPADSGATQPLTEHVMFEYVGDRPSGQESGFLLELVLKTGMPPAVYRVPIFIDWDQIHSRGTNPPL